ncbi:phosphonate ABC transporter substrate-binding protein [Pseudomonas sp. PSKL.D1]|uniref:phosphonate ABC transporter substrate-binding protein n=1 Tax=Pseudomonas sp. PSKL.D1 TaxID=3029060 RepID=UPI0023817251|nr:phosphonate ABC transporter substrate-binding protein [Pseudomonas sp. PSKL.D1]WDY55736.1 phosphonate ABC transporter substrate-binding protein [Pseudomonas sp. PSKL.D1]
MNLIRKLMLAASVALLASHSAQAADAVRIGLIPSEDSQAMIEGSKQVLDQLQQHLGMPVEPFVATDYNGVIEALRAGKLDVAYLGPFSYVLASQVAGAEAFAVAETQKTGKSAYRSVIVVRSDSPIQSLADFKGHTFAFVDPSSASGHLFPKAGVEKAGYQPEQLFKRVIFSGSHDASILAVANGKVDGAAVADRILASAIAAGEVGKDDLRVVWSSAEIPESPMAFRKNLDPALKHKLAAAMAQVKNVAWTDQGMLNGFQPTNDAAYDVVRETAQVLDLDLGGMK